MSTEADKFDQSLTELLDTPEWKAAQLAFYGVAGTPCRIRISVNNSPTEYMEFSVGKTPKTQLEWADILDEYVRMLRAPDVSDEEVLGKFSPKLTNKEKRHLAEQYEFGL